MQVSRHRTENSVPCERVQIRIGEVTYTLTESVDGKLCVNKIADEGSDVLMVFPRYGNEIELL